MGKKETCRICGAECAAIGTVAGKFRKRTFHLYSCPACSFSFISDPWTDYKEIYSADYYCGRGADPLVDYLFELEHPESAIRRYEWRGILEAVRSLVSVGPETRWLDYGCGNGGLVRYCNENAGCGAAGFEEGWIKEKAAAAGVPFIGRKDLEGRRGSFDIVTAIEVLEHAADPLESLRFIRFLLKPGGLFFYTTGNAGPFRGRLPQWSYVLPEAHISFFEPGTLDLALKKTGFRTEFRGFLPGFADIVRFKVLKSLRLRERSLAESLLPWGALARIVDKRYQLSAHPVGWARD